MESVHTFRATTWRKQSQKDCKNKEVSAPVEKPRPSCAPEPSSYCHYWTYTFTTGAQTSIALGSRLAHA